MHKTHKNEKSELKNEPDGVRGRKAHITSDRNIIIKGDKRKIKEKEFLENINSLNKSFNASAIGWIKPNIPTKSGPFLRWTAEIIFLSNKVKYATIKIKIRAKTKK